MHKMKYYKNNYPVFYFVIGVSLQSGCRYAGHSASGGNNNFIEKCKLPKIFDLPGQVSLIWKK